MSGIVSYGYYVPRYRIKTETIAAQWGKCDDKIEKSLKVHEKAVAGLDEDVATMSYAASTMAFGDIKETKQSIGAVFIGSETFPYAVKPVSTSIAEWLDIPHGYLALDTQFACKAATGALIAAHGLVASKQIDHALICAADRANAKPNDALEYAAGSGANAWVLGNENVLAEIEGWSSYSSDTPDFWRRSKQDYPSHAGRFSGEPGYFQHLLSASNNLLTKLNRTAENYTYAAFHMPNGAFPLKAAKSLGFTVDQLKASYIVPQLGNSYAASALMGLVGTLEVAQPGETIFFCSYGSGAGADAISFKVTKEILKRRRVFAETLQQKTYIDYATYLRFMGMI
ncbi:MAG: hydroxymethylglutaryl-CoA synthase [Weeksellaceae bacterium]